ncbi:MAG TPA: 30S ribosomal protein S17e [Candidatus Nanoarchaeia archaeon]|nr:30S ribosomal protein S17e [Candidatus Nanoarchaeia archaeon]
MGKIKSKQVKRSSQELIGSGINFSEDFEKNKKILGSEMPSKKMRNKMAGYLARFMRRKKSEAEALKTE